MGMDVYGIRPTAPIGDYFRRNVWGWHPLATLVCKLAPTITQHCAHWHSNGGDGLSAKHATRLATALDVALSSGRVAMLVALRQAKLRRLPRQTCTHCNGTGVRTDEIGRRLGYDQRVIEAKDSPRHGTVGWCNGCDSRGTTRPSETHYSVCEADLREFAAFLRESGGFRIC